EMLDLDRFANMRVVTSLQRPLDISLHSETGKRDSRYGSQFRSLPQPSNEFVAIHSRHLDVGYNNARILAGSQLEASQGVLCSQNIVSQLTKFDSHQIQDIDRILDKQNLLQVLLRLDLSGERDWLGQSRVLVCQRQLKTERTAAAGAPAF